MLDKYLFFKQNTKHHIATNQNSQGLIQSPISRNGPIILKPQKKKTNRTLKDGVKTYNRSGILYIAFNMCITLKSSSISESFQMQHKHSFKNRK